MMSETMVLEILWLRVAMLFLRDQPTFNHWFSYKSYKQFLKSELEEGLWKYKPRKEGLENGLVKA